MTFTIVEDIKTLLTDNFDLKRLPSDGDFELGDVTIEWVVNGAVASTTQKHGGTYSAKFTNVGHTLIQSNLYIPVDDLTAATFWRYFATAGGSGSNKFGWGVTYNDTTSTTVLFDADNLDSWVEEDILSSLDTGVGKIITKWTFSDTGSTECYMDDLVFTYNVTSPNVRLKDDDPYEVDGVPAYPDNGEIIIGREQFLRIDPFNGSRTETFLVDIDVLYPDNDSSTTLKAILAEIDRVFDAESLAHTSYYYKPRYDWLGSYRTGHVRFQVEVMNALVVRPSLV